MHRLEMACTEAEGAQKLQTKGGLGNTPPRPSRRIPAVPPAAFNPIGLSEREPLALLEEQYLGGDAPGPKAAHGRIREAE